MTDAAVTEKRKLSLDNIRTVGPGVVRGTCSGCGLIAQIDNGTKAVSHTEPFCHPVLEWHRENEGLKLSVYAPTNRKQKRADEALQRSQTTRGVRRR